MSVWWKLFLVLALALSFSVGIGACDDDDDDDDDAIDDDTTDDDISDDDVTDDDIIDDDTVDDDTVDDDTVDDDTVDDDTVDDDTVDDDTIDDDTIDDDTVDDDTADDDTTTCVDCSSPLATVSIPTDLPYSDTEQTTCGACDSYSDTCMGLFDEAEDVIYEITVTELTTVKFGIDPGFNTYSGLALGDTCPLDATTCLASSYGDNTSAPHESECVTLEPGTYYLQVDSHSIPSCLADYDLTISDCTTSLYTDDFDAYPTGAIPPSPWSVDESGATAHVESIPIDDIPPNRGLHLVSEGSSYAYAWYTHGTAVTSTLGVNFDAMWVSGTSCYMTMGNFTTYLSNELLLQFTFAGNLEANLPLSSANQVCASGLTAGQWYNITMLADVETQTFDIYLDGVATDCMGIGFWHGTSATQLNTFDIHSPAAAAGNFWIDELEMFTF